MSFRFCCEAHISLPVETASAKGEEGGPGGVRIPNLKEVRYHRRCSYYTHSKSEMLSHDRRADHGNGKY
jgi:hypothetical protein